MIKILIQILLAFAKTETAKEIGKYAVKKVVDSTDNSIDNEMAAELLGDISKSNGNAIKQTALNEAKTALRDRLDIRKVSSSAYDFLTNRMY